MLGGWLYLSRQFATARAQPTLSVVLGRQGDSAAEQVHLCPHDFQTFTKAELLPSGLNVPQWMLSGLVPHRP